jgi:hypothetical protein
MLESGGNKHLPPGMGGGVSSGSEVLGFNRLDGDVVHEHPIKFVV